MYSTFASSEKLKIGNLLTVREYETATTITKSRLPQHTNSFATFLQIANQSIHSVLCVITNLSANSFVRNEIFAVYWYCCKYLVPVWMMKMSDSKALLFCHITLCTRINVVCLRHISNRFHHGLGWAGWAVASVRAGLCKFPHIHKVTRIFGNASWIPVIGRL